MRHRHNKNRALYKLNKLHAVDYSELSDIANIQDLNLSADDLREVARFAHARKRAFNVIEFQLLSKYWQISNCADKSIDQIEICAENPHHFEALRKYRIAEGNLKTQFTSLNSIIFSGAALAANCELNNKREFSSVPLTSEKRRASDAYGVIATSKSSLTTHAPRALYITNMKMLGDFGQPICMTRSCNIDKNLTPSESTLETANYAYESGIATALIDDNSSLEAETNCETIFAIGVASNSNAEDFQPSPGDYIVLITSDQTLLERSRGLKELFENRNAAFAIRSSAVGASLVQQLLSLNAGVNATFGNLNQLEQFIECNYTDDIILIIKKGRAGAFVRSLPKSLKAIMLGRITRDDTLTLSVHNKRYVCLPTKLLIHKNIGFTSVNIIDKPLIMPPVALDEIKKLVFDSFRTCPAHCNPPFDRTISGGSSLPQFIGIRKLLQSNITAYDISRFENSRTLITSFSNISSHFLGSPFAGTVNSVVYAVSKLISQGVPLSRIGVAINCIHPPGMTQNTLNDLSAVALGCFYAITHLNVKMLSANFEPLSKSQHVSVSVVATGIGISQVFPSRCFRKKQRLYRLPIIKDEYSIPDFKRLRKLYNLVTISAERGRVESLITTNDNPLVDIVNALEDVKTGVTFVEFADNALSGCWGDFIVATEDMSDFATLEYEYIGVVDDTEIIKGAESSALIGSLSEIIPPFRPDTKSRFKDYKTFTPLTRIPKTPMTAKPAVFIPRVDSISSVQLARSFALAGGKVSVASILNTSSDYELLKLYAKSIANSQILALSANNACQKIINSYSRYYKFFSNPIVINAVKGMLDRGGLILGFGEGMRTLFELGLIPFGEFRTRDNTSADFIDPKRFGGSVVSGIVVSELSPWMYGSRIGQEIIIPTALNPGNIFLSSEMKEQLENSGQITTYFVDEELVPTSQDPYNPCGSSYGVEGISSPDGHILGRIGQYERNIKSCEQSQDTNIFMRGINFFK
jgi:phosphoribosylformylglycinamidine (FGAM) synthase-like amidotransferase family enzyme